MRDAKSKADTLPIVSMIFLGVLIATPALALGAVHTAVASIYFGLSGIFTIYLFLRQKAHAPHLDLPSIMLLCLGTFTFFQIIPLPAVLVKIIAPAVYEVRAGCLSPLHKGSPTFMPLSLDVTLTMVELGKTAMYLSIYWGVHHVVRRFGARIIFRLLIGGGIAAAAVLLTHKILMQHQIYGLYTPMFAASFGERVSAPLLNENHMAAFLGLCTAAALGYALGRSGGTERTIGFGAAAFIGGAMVLTLSRGGIVAFVLGQCLFIAMRLERRFRRKRPTAHLENPAWLPLGLALALGLGLFAAQDAVVGEFLNGNARKLDFIAEGVPLIGRFWTTGLGRGAFRVGFHMVSGLGGNVTATHAENAPVQLLADFGILVGGAALLGAAALLGRFLIRPPERVEHAALLAGLIAFVVHNLIDFNMEIIGVAVIAVAVIGLLCGIRSLRIQNGDIRRIPMPWVHAVSAVCLGASILSMVYARPYHPDTEHARYRRALADHSSELFSDTALEAALRRHPADSYLPHLAGVRIYHSRLGNPLAWFARAVTLYPEFAEAHFYIGGTLLRAGRLNQAMLEFRIAARAEPHLANAAANLLVSRTNSFEQLAGIAVTEADKKLLWPALANGLSIHGAANEAEAADKAVLAMDPLDPRSAARQIRRLVARGSLKEADAMTAAFKKHPEFGLTGFLLEAEISATQNDWSRTASILEGARRLFGDDVVLLERLAWARMRLGDTEAALRMAGILKSKSLEITDRLRATLLEARLLEASGRIQSALSKLREARILAPDNESVLRQTFDLANRHGDHGRALEALRLLISLKPNDDELKETLKRYQNENAGAGLSPKGDIF